MSKKKNAGKRVMVKYPNCTVKLSGTSGNSVAIFMAVQRQLVRYLVDMEGMSQQDAETKGKEFVSEATSGDEHKVLATCFNWVTIV